MDERATASIADDERVHIGDAEVVDGPVLEPAVVVELLDDAEFAVGALKEVADGEVVGIGPAIAFDPDGVVGGGGPGVDAWVVVGVAWLTICPELFSNAADCEMTTPSEVRT